MSRINSMTDMATVVEVMEVTDVLKGKRFSISGHLGRVRQEVVSIITQAGGYFDKAPVYGTHYLICNMDWTEGSTVRSNASRKLLKAREMGTTVITEAQFYDMLMTSDEVCASE